MAFTKNYYLVLGLPTPSSSQDPPSQDALRKAYKAALLRAHPDKKACASASTSSNYTIDDIRDALAILSDSGRRAALDRWLAAQRQQQGHSNAVEPGGAAAAAAAEGYEDFVLGLEMLDLSDFEAGVPPFVRFVTPPPLEGEGEEVPDVLELDFDDLRPLSSGEMDGEGEGDGVQHAGGEEGEGEAQGGAEEDGGGRGGEGEMEWTRGCRCGAEKGFCIKERELEEAEGRGEKEVLVGCEGCSLWVRVGFDVEEG